MGGLRPRDPVDIAGPRPLAGLLVRPLNFTVRRREKHMLLSLAWTIPSIAPYALLTAAGFLLWRRERSVATMAIALGFALAFLAQVVGFLVELETSAFVRAYKDDGSFVMVHAHAFPRFAHYAGLVGFWVGAIALVWYAIGRRTSPNQRLERP